MRKGVASKTGHVRLAPCLWHTCPRTVASFTSRASSDIHATGGLRRAFMRVAEQSGVSCPSRMQHVVPGPCMLSSLVANCACVDAQCTCACIGARLSMAWRTEPCSTNREVHDFYPWLQLLGRETSPHLSAKGLSGRGRQVAARLQAALGRPRRK